MPDETPPAAQAPEYSMSTRNSDSAAGLESTAWVFVQGKAMDRKNARLLNKQLVAAACALSLASHLSAWGAPAAALPSLPMPGAQALQDGWRDPPPEYGPEPYYGLAADVSASGIGAELDRLHGLGFRAVTVQYTRDMPFAYLSPEYFEFFKRLVAAARQRGMRIWIVDDAGYPSGFAGGAFTQTMPALRMQALVGAGDWPLAPGEALDQAAPAGLVAVSAINRDDGDIRALTLQDGRIRWQAPNGGHWHVVAVAHAFRTSPTRSDTNPNKTKDGSQSLHDYLDPAATSAYLRVTHAAYEAALGAEFGKTILGFRGDEPDYSVNGLPWTPSFIERFQQWKGYDPRPYLPVLLQPKDVPLSSQQSLFRADYYDVFSRLFADSFFRQQAEWCEQRGLDYQVHLNLEEKQIDLAAHEGDFFRDMQAVQSPGIDAIWHQIWPDTIADYPRFASSVAHLNGRAHAMTESFAAYRPAPSLPVVRYAVNEQLVRGINLFEFMYLHGGRTPGGYLADPGFPALAEYVRRASYLMSMGRPDAHVAVLQSRGALWARDKAADDMFVSTERLLSEAQVDFDLVDEDAIGARLRAGQGSFETASGNRYRTVIVPLPDLMPQAVVDRLRAFAQGGGTVLFLGRTPARVVTTTYLQARAAQPHEFDWAVLAPELLAPVPTPPAYAPPAAPAPLDPPAALLAAVRAAVGSEELVLDSADPAIRTTRRALADARVFMVFNESAAPAAHRAILRGPGTRVERWDPASGAVSPLPSRPAPDGRSIELDLGPYDSMFIVLRR